MLGANRSVSDLPAPFQRYTLVFDAGDCMSARSVAMQQNAQTISTRPTGRSYVTFAIDLSWEGGARAV